MANEQHPQSAPGSNAQTARADHDHESAPDHPPAHAGKASIGLLIVAIAVVVFGGMGIWKRHHNNEVLADTTQREAAPSVIAIQSRAGQPTDTLILPGNVTAFSDAPLYARTSGYVTKWYYDIGARVKKGALLAEIDTPELDEQVRQGEADLNTAETNAGNAKKQAERYTGLVDSDAVSRQDTETFQTQAASTSSAVRSAQANVARLKQLQAFEKVYAPFDGVVTARGIDNGQLINEGTGTELFHVQALQTLRVYTNVPEMFTGSVKRGQKVQLTFPQYPGRNFEGSLVRTADAIDPSSRTLLVEIDIDNRKGELMPGSLAQVHFKSQAVGQTFIVPAAAIIFRRDGLRIGTVVNGNIAHLAPVTIGQDNGATVEVISGLNANDLVIQDPPDSLIEGEKLYVEQPRQQGNAPAQQGQPAGAQNNGGK
jgi:RND family efflux transporter MFP subunit